jgi:hypothetical protein
MTPEIDDETCIINNISYTTTKNRKLVLYYIISLVLANWIFEINIINNMSFLQGGS